MTMLAAKIRSACRVSVVCAQFNGVFLGTRISSVTLQTYNSGLARTVRDLLKNGLTRLRVSKRTCPAQTEYYTRIRLEMSTSKFLEDGDTQSVIHMDCAYSGSRYKCTFRDVI